MILLLLYFVCLVCSCISINPIDTKCVTPNLENANCVLLESCPHIFDGVKSLNETVIDFARQSVCKVEGNDVYVCCGTLTYYINNTCVNHNNENGRCVQLLECPLIFDGLKSLNYEAVLFAKKSVCKNDGSTLSVCCPLPPSPPTTPILGVVGTTTQKPTVSPDDFQLFTENGHQISTNATETRVLTTIKPKSRTTPTFKTVASTTKKAVPGTIKNISPVITTKKTPISDRRFCGLQHTDDRFYVRNDTAMDEFPWMALLIHENGTVNEQQHCLGMLINSRYVLTTAICVNNTDALEGFKITSVRLGHYNTNSTSDCVPSGGYEQCSDPAIRANVEQAILHPQFKLDPSGIGHNIALIRLATQISYTDYVRPICLPELKKSAGIGESLTTSGWGTSTWEQNTEKKFNIKKRGEGVLVPLRECIDNSEINLEGAINDKNHLCFREESGNGPCLDDSSAPLMSTKNRQWQLEGIMYVPTAQRCGKGALFVFLNVTSYVKWIEETIQP